jgi:hypothetical protein
MEILLGFDYTKPSDFKSARRFSDAIEPQLSTLELKKAAFLRRDFPA